MAGEKILVVDDEKQICDLIQSYLVKEGFDSVFAYDGKGAMETLKNEDPDLVILDFMLPDIEGPELCLNMRRQTDIPIIFLSCRSEEMDKVVSLSAGGDDYITKPFLPGELIARIKANLRRTRVQESSFEDENETIKAGDLEIDPEYRTVRVRDKAVNLTAKEFDILLLLVKNPKKIFSADQLFKIIWKTASLSSDPKTVSVHISAIRKKLETPGVDYIINIRNIGYKFNHKLLEAGD